MNLDPNVSHPNATRAVGGGAGAVVVVWLLGYLGVPVSAEEGAALATISGGLFVFIGREGIRGAVTRLWHGEKPPRRQ